MSKYCYACGEKTITASYQLQGSSHSYCQKCADGITRTAIEKGVKVAGAEEVWRKKLRKDTKQKQETDKYNIDGGTDD